ncbi:hypothetical protein B9T65_25175 [Serratia marcescens]|uniref:hypothetical protein n=1 Tax=Serratia marcescens TaxID=615 RepID=UPI000BFED1A1|nr:hypothetical protein [Serratia marcescens]PHI44602.1 hypothetical protein B9T65_25175 [Serratia marcescens]
MDNKLSKPVAEVVSKFGDPEAFGEREIKLLTGIQQMAYGTKFYSQEYVSALLAELEAKDKRIIELEAIKSDASQVLKEIGNELGCNPDNESIMMAIDALKEREKRVVALAGGNADLWETMAARLEAAEAKLATPVRLLGEMLLHDWEHSVERQATFQHRKIAWDARLAEDKKAILAAGFTFTVEGDEQ